MDAFKQSIYKKLDTEGIKGTHLSSFSFSVNEYSAKMSTQERQRVFDPDLSEFGLSGPETEDFIIDYVYDTVNVKISSVNELMQMRSVNGKPFFLLLESSKTTYCLALEKIPGAVTFRKDDGIISLGYIKEINGGLGFMDSTVNDLGTLKKVIGDFWVWGDSVSQLTSLFNVEFIGGDLNLKKSQITDFGALTHIGGNLNLRGKEPFSFGNLKYIGKNLMLSKKYKDKFITEDINIIGKIKYFDDKEI
ncbi:MAG: hypothetical protein H7141_03655 [Burkholderiales bacterium]|nr:hypothetical protein [Bacteroidia bacterium]